MNKQILISLSMIAGVAAIVIGGTIAYFSDTEISTENTLTAGTLDLSVNDRNPLEGPIVTLQDLKPDSIQVVEKNFKILDNPANVYLRIKDVVCNEGKETEPEEAEEGPNQRCNFNEMTSYGLIVDDEMIIDLNDNRTLAPYEAKGVVSCWIPLGIYEPMREIPVIQSFHMGKDITNWAQGDVVTFSEEFSATQVDAPAPSPLCQW